MLCSEIGRKESCVRVSDCVVSLRCTITVDTIVASPVEKVIRHSCMC